MKAFAVMPCTFVCLECRDHRDTRGEHAERLPQCNRRILPVLAHIGPLRLRVLVVRARADSVRPGEAQRKAEFVELVHERGRSFFGS